MDTTPLVDMYFTKPEDHNYDWRGISSRKNYISTRVTTRLIPIFCFFKLKLKLKYKFNLI